jgi:DNA (cytosine-5)-methyltransferase 1
MPRKQLLIRDVGPAVRDWIQAELKRRGVSQNQLLLALLDSAATGDVQPSLFAGLEPPPRAITPPTVPFTFIDLFAGIGGFRIGLTRAGGRCVFTSEWDRYAQQTYSAWFHDEHVRGDINDPKIMDAIPPHDVLAAGFPCQPFSIAGVSKKNALGHAHGFDCKKQGNLFFRICDIVDVKRPPILILENVKNLRSHDKGRTWAVIRSELESRRYKVFAEVVDAIGWVPQHRERIFIVCFDRDVFGDHPQFKFPEPPQGPQLTLRAVLEPSPPSKYTLTDHLWNYLQRYAAKHKAKGNGFGFGLVGPDNTTRTLSARYYKDGSEILIDQGSGKNPRRLTIREAARLMGYDDEAAATFGHSGGFPQVVSDTQAYKQFGNSVVPKVVEAVAREVMETVRSHYAKTNDGCLLKGRLRPSRRQVGAATKLSEPAAVA